MLDINKVFKQGHRLGHKMGHRGFTLIELLVVIAIIGILASVVLASLNTARNKGADAAVKGALSQVRAQAEIFYDNGNTYVGLCSSLSAMLNNAKSSGGATQANNITYATTGAGSTVTCHENGSTSYAVEAPLKGGGFFCVDSSGAATTTGAFSLGPSDAVCG